MATKYTRQKDREPEDVGIFRIACCDCGLVHKMGFAMASDGTMRIDYKRDERATAQVRRGKMPYLKYPRKKDKWKMIRNNEM